MSDVIKIDAGHVNAPLKLWPEERIQLAQAPAKEAGKIIQALCRMASGFDYNEPKDQISKNIFARLAHKHLTKTLVDWTKASNHGKNASASRWKKAMPEVMPEHNPEHIPEDIPGVCTNRSIGQSVNRSSKRNQDLNPVPFAQATGKTERNGMVLDSVKRRVREFRNDLNMCGEGTFYEGGYDATTICLYLTDDYGSIRRWGQLAREKGEINVISEAVKFWHEINAGEEPNNRGAALNARLSKLPDIEPTGKRGEA